MRKSNFESERNFEIFMASISVVRNLVSVEIAIRPLGRRQLTEFCLVDIQCGGVTTGI